MAEETVMKKTPSTAKPAEEKSVNKEKESLPAISASPHIRKGPTTTGIMADVLIALVPAAAMGIYNFGYRAALMILICITGCMVFEYLSGLLLRRPGNTVRDLSAAVTGMLLALNLPVDLPYWMALLGCLFGIVVVKQLFGGIGQNFMNPALAARCFLVMSFVGPMTHFTYDAVTTATPLYVLRTQGVGNIDLWSMFIGKEAGTIGETSAAALLLGALYLLFRGVIRLTIPASYIGTFSLLILIYGLTEKMNAEELFRYTVAHVTSGGLILGACYMATDYTTSPITGKGRIVYGILLGLLTFFFRIFGSNTEGVSYAIIIGNLLVPMIEMVTKPKAFGHGYEKKSLSENRGFLPPLVTDEEGKPVADRSEKKNSPLRILISICLIALLAGGLLGAVYALTKAPIEETANRKKQESYRAVMSEATDYIETDDLEKENAMLEKEGFAGVTLEIRALAMKEDEPVGNIWVVTTHEGYAGDIRMAVGIRDGRVTGVEMLSIGETAGLGLEARDNPDFTAQYVDKNADYFTVTKNSPQEEDQIQAITGATITSGAVTNAVNAALAADRFLQSDSFVQEGGSEDE